MNAGSLGRRLKDPRDADPTSATTSRRSANPNSCAPWRIGVPRRGRARAGDDHASNWCCRSPTGPTWRRCARPCTSARPGRRGRRAHHGRRGAARPAQLPARSDGGAPGPGSTATATAPRQFLDELSKTRVLGISSGKGGVGKSSVTVNLAIALAQAGHRVGVLDADVYGFSLPKMLGAANDPIVLGDTVIPTLAHGVRCLSMGYFVTTPSRSSGADRCCTRRSSSSSPRRGGTSRTSCLIDMPPGTGDVALTLSGDPAARRDVRRHDPAGGRPARRPALRLRRAKAEARGARRHREHELVHRRRRPALRDLRRRRRRATGARARRHAARPDPARAGIASRRRRG